MGLAQREEARNEDRVDPAGSRHVVGHGEHGAGSAADEPIWGQCLRRGRADPATGSAGAPGAASTTVESVRLSLRRVSGAARLWLSAAHSRAAAVVAAGVSAGLLSLRGA